MRDRGIIDADESQVIRLVEPHRNGIAVEQKAERGLAQFQVGDVGQGDRQQISGRADPDLEMDVAGAPGGGQLELIVPARFERREQAGGDAGSVEAAFEFREAPPLRRAYAFRGAPGANRNMTIG
jgi:hypothetical protein